MRLAALLLVSFVVQSTTEILQVKCGDEKCERPSNKAVTTLRYTPDKPYKLQISAVNSEVEIFGMTDDLYYIRHGKNFGFLPKNHLREKARGNYPFNVEIDISDKRIDQQVREQNFLHEFLKHEVVEKEQRISEPLNDSVIAQPELNQADLPTIVQEEAKVIQISEAPELHKPEEVRDAPIPSETLADIKNSSVNAELPKSVEPQIEIKESAVENISEPAPVKEDVIELKAVDLISPELSDVPFQFETLQSVETTTEDKRDSSELRNNNGEVPPELNQPGFSAMVQEEAKSIQTSEASELYKPEKVQDTPIPSETLADIKNSSVITQLTKNEELASEIDESVAEDKSEQATVKEKDVIGTIDPKLTEIPNVLPQYEAPHLVQSIAENQIAVEQNFELPEQHVPFKTAETLLQQKPSQLEPDALLQRFNEKLGNRVVENTEKEKVEPLPKREINIHHQPDHVDHIISDKTSPVLEVKSPPTVKEEKPGFFSQLSSKFFSNKDVSKDHLNHEAEFENAFNPSDKINPDSDFCEKIDSENCPQSLNIQPKQNMGRGSEWQTADEYLRILLNKTFEMMDLIISMGLTGITVLIFTLGYYCISKSRKEGPLIAKVRNFLNAEKASRKMNEMERHLMVSIKENEILKLDIIATRQKLQSIEDNHFGSNDMVIALKQDLESTEQIKNELAEKNASLEKELAVAAEDGLELNRMVIELLNNQSGSESIISSVEDLQHQLNEQQKTIVTMNETLASKSRENSELQIQLADVNGRFQGDFQTFQHQIDAIALERSNLQIELENLKRESDVQTNQLIEERNSEVTRLNSELTIYAKNYEDTLKTLNIADSKVQALEECLNAVKKNSKGVAFKELFDIAELKADLLAVTKEKSTLHEQLQTEKDSRKLLEERVKSITEEMLDLKKEFGVAEKEKLEAQTRLEVLSTYFKEKETQLQQELSLKEARWMKQQGETTSTVEKVQALNVEIQALRSQNDSLRVEIEAQVTAHKLNISSHEAQSHAAWLNARQAERKLEESRMESAALRRRLTLIVENPAGASELLNGLSGINDTMNSISSPIRVESPNNGHALPPAPIMMPPFLPQGFLPGAPPPFLPPPPFMPGEMAPPLGRLLSPPPKRFIPAMKDDRDRYSPRGRGRYSPDSRYDDYTAFETETDYSPPPSPNRPRRGYNSPSDRSKKSKGSTDLNPITRRK